MTVRDTALTDTFATATPDAEPMPLQMDEDAFRGFYERTARMLWSYLERLTGDRNQADDLLQETYYRLLKCDVPFETEAHRRHYLFRIATNLAHDRFRRSRATPAHVTHDESATIPSGERAGMLDARIDVTGAMARLPNRDRALLWLAYAEGVSHKEIAAVVGVRAKSVKTLLFRARRRLATMLGGTGRPS